MYCDLADDTSISVNSSLRSVITTDSMECQATGILKVTVLFSSTHLASFSLFSTFKHVNTC